LTLRIKTLDEPRYCGVYRLGRNAIGEEFAALVEQGDVGRLPDTIRGQRPKRWMNSM